MILKDQAGDSLNISGRTA